MKKSSYLTFASFALLITSALRAEDSTTPKSPEPAKANEVSSQTSTATPAASESDATSANEESLHDTLADTSEEYYDDEPEVVMRNWALTPQVGLSYLQSSRDIIDQSQSSLDLKLDYSAAFTDHWTFGVGFDALAFPLSQAQLGASWQFSLQALAASSTAIASTGWDLGFGFGPRYGSLLASTSQPGVEYRGLAGISLIPSLIRPLPRNSQAVISFRMTPSSMENAFAMEWNPGMTYQFAQDRQGSSMGISAEYSSTYLHSNDSMIKKYSLGLSYTF